MKAKQGAMGAPRGEAPGEREESGVQAKSRVREVAAEMEAEREGAEPDPEATALSEGIGRTLAERDPALTAAQEASIWQRVCDRLMGSA